MQIEVTDSDVRLVALAGRLDSAGVGEAGDAFVPTLAGGPGGTIVDLSLVEFMASIGMRVFIETAQALEANGRKLVLMAPTEMVAESLRIAGLNTMIPVAKDEAEARGLLA